MNEQMIGSAQQLIERHGTSDEALRRRIADQEEEPDTTPSRTLLHAQRG